MVFFRRTASSTEVLTSTVTSVPYLLADNFFNVGSSSLANILLELLSLFLILFFETQKNTKNIGKEIWNRFSLLEH